jgi:MoaA/NifB/PqqE/SkfB family radical SAM enzyme
VKPRDRVVAPHLRRVIDEGLTRLPFAPAVINCSHDRSCNLACPSCRTEVLIQRNHQDAILAIQDRINDEALQHAKQLYITGSGDPFGSPYFRRWLQEMRLEDAPQLTSIHLHSNAQMWTPRIWETIDPEIRNLIRTTEISVDAATPETYAINRWPGDFKRLLENLEFIVSLRRNGPLRDVVLSMVVQENNFREMPGFIELGKRVGVDRVVFSQITNWGTFSEDDFTTRAVHSPSHPRHQEFRTMLAAPLFASHFVFLGNLADLRST